MPSPTARRRRRRRIAGLAVTTAALAASAASAASAATPIPLGPGSGGVVAVDSTGAGHLAWVGSDRAAHYCTLPAGATACTGEVTLPKYMNNADVGALNIYATSPSNLELFAGTYPDASWVVRYASTNGGVTWSGPVAKAAGSSDTNPTRGRNWLDASDRFLVAGGKYFQALDTGTNNVAESMTQLFSNTSDYDATDAIGSDGTGGSLLADAQLTGNDIHYAVYKGNPVTATRAQLNTAGNWDADLMLPAGGSVFHAPELIGGPSGVFAVFPVNLSPLVDRVAISRLDPATHRFGAPVLIDADNPLQLSATEDPSGRIHIVWQGSGGDTLRYAQSTDGGQTFTTLGSLTTTVNGNGFSDTDVSAAASSRGVAIYYQANQVYAIRLEPVPDSTTPPPAATPISTPAPAPTPVRPPVVRATPVVVLRPTTVRVSGATISFSVPKSCVPAGSTFRVTLTFKRQKRKGNKFVKVRRSDFYVGTTRMKIDTRAPFVQTLTVKASARSGSRISLRARAFIKVTRGRSPTKSIHSQIKVC